MHIFQAQNAQISYVTLGKTGGSGTGPAILWAHGWGQNHKAFLPLAESLSGMGQHTLVDFPGFGQAPAPTEALGTEQYADAMAEFLKGKEPVIWIGHSFGCRVGLQMAAKYPQMIKGMFFIAGAGLKRRRPIRQQMSMRARIALYKTLKRVIPAEKLQPYFGSADYRNSGVMRPILVKVISEDLSLQAEKVNCPVMLAYGTKDTETPPEIGERLNKLIPGSELLLFDGLDHYTIIGESRHQVAPHLKKFIEKNSHA